jgi:hypothetical protein
VAERSVCKGRRDHIDIDLAIAPSVDHALSQVGAGHLGARDNQQMESVLLVHPSA